MTDKQLKQLKHDGAVHDAPDAERRLDHARSEVAPLERLRHLRDLHHRRRHLRGDRH